MGWTAEQVAAWKAPSRDVLLGSYEAMKASARNYLASIRDAGLDESVMIANESRHGLAPLMGAAPLEKFIPLRETQDCCSSIQLLNSPFGSGHPMRQARGFVLGFQETALDSPSLGSFGLPPVA